MIRPAVPWQYRPKEGGRLLWIVMDLVAFLTMLHAVFPPLNAALHPVIGQFLGAIVWLFMAIVLRPSFFLRFSKHQYLWILLILYTTLIPRLVGNETIGNRYVSLSMLFFFYIVYEFNRQYGSWIRNFRIAMGLAPFILFTCFKTLGAVLVDPWIARSINTSKDVNSAIIMKQGIGGYDFIYMLLCLVIIFSGILFARWSDSQLALWKKINLIILIGFSMFTILRSNFFTPVPVYATAMISLFVFSNLKLATKLMVSTGVMILLFFLVSYPVVNINDFIGDGRTAERVELLLSQKNTTVVISDRNEVNDQSFKDLNEYTLVGIIYNKIEKEREGYLVGFGQHSYFLDTFALFGAVIGAIQFYCILQPFWVRIQKLAPYRNLAIAMLFSVLLLFLYDNATPSIGVAIYFVFPLICDYLQRSFNNIPMRESV